MSDENKEPVAKTMELLSNCRSGAFIFRPQKVGRDEHFEGKLDVHAVKRFLESEKTLVMNAGIIVDSVQSRGRSDPPDCQAVDAYGRKYGFELTELLDEDYIKNLKTKSGRNDPKQYSKESLIAKLQECLDKKTRSFRSIHGSPYHKLILVVIINEPLLSFAFCNESLGLWRFPRTPWDLAFLCLPPSVPHAPLMNAALLNYKVIPVGFSI